ncbi:MAG TPA: ABC transporter substrate-binding protein [Solirubrobacteraceae bacterium]|nr:ABC transporter substrate-binding protein [Solirubrobacteraceae bacterium]
MGKHMRAALLLAATLVAALVVAACGSSNNSGGSSNNSTSSSTSSSGGKQGGTITIDSGTAPLSADQALDFTTQGTELYSVVNTPLLTFRRGAQGTAGAQILPALAKSLPKFTDGGKTLTFQLRPGLKYSNGQAIKASDVTYGLERDLKIPWQAASFISGYIVGADAYSKGKAKTISGITTNNSTGTIAVHMVAPFAPMEDIFALAGTAPVPSSTAMKNLASTGTLGDGPYKWGTINPGHTYTLVKNPNFSGVANVPSGHADKIVYNVNDNVLANAENVLNNQADVFDPGDTLPPSILQQVKTQAASRFASVPTNSSYYWFFNVQKKPFNNLSARQAVLAALDDRALSRLDSGFITPDCHLIPLGIVGHSSPSACPYHNPAGPPNMTEAKALMKKSGMIGQPVTVWGEERSPRKEWTDYYTQVLNQLGFKATEKIINSGVYFTTIGAPGTKPQTGFGDWVQDFPNPWDFMQLFAGNAGSSLNYGYVNDSHYNSTLNKLFQKTPESVASQWSALDQYAVKNAYYAAYGHEDFPKFYSSRLNFNTGVLSVEYQTDLTSLELK